jgi:NAD(P)-dependent dehydrogenase (short-subunit alcohol dehydrogenase family)
MSASNVLYDANEFTGKQILVTGGSKGIGEAIVNRLLRGGATVLATARTISAGANAEKFIQADVSTRAGADHIIKTTFEWLGGLDILINSVGGSSAPGGGVLALTDADWQQEFELNLFSAVRLDRGFLPATTLWSHHPCIVHPANAPVIRSYPGLRRRQSRSHQLQQRTLQGSRPARHPRE